MPPDLEEKVKFFRTAKKRTLGKCSNFFVFKDFFIKNSVQSDLLLKRTNLESLKFHLIMKSCSQAEYRTPMMSEFCLFIKNLPSETDYKTFKKR